MKEDKTVSAMKTTVGVIMGVILCFFVMCGTCVVCVGISKSIDNTSK